MYTGRMIEGLIGLVDGLRVPSEAVLREQAELEFRFSPLEEMEAEQATYEEELAGVM